MMCDRARASEEWDQLESRVCYKGHRQRGHSAQTQTQKRLDEEAEAQVFKTLFAELTKADVGSNKEHSLVGICAET